MCEEMVLSSDGLSSRAPTLSTCVAFLFLQEESQNVECTCVTGRDQTSMKFILSWAKNIWSLKNHQWQVLRLPRVATVKPVRLWGRSEAWQVSVFQQVFGAFWFSAAAVKWWPHRRTSRYYYDASSAISRTQLFFVQCCYSLNDLGGH